MAYDERLAERVRVALAGTPGVEERKMFGGVAFMIGEKMAIGVLQSDLMVRVGPDTHDDALRRKGARPMDFTGRPMRGFLFVGPEGHRTRAALVRWVNLALTYNRVASATTQPRRLPSTRRQDPRRVGR